MSRALLFLFAIVVLYGSGFLYHETGPVVYSLISLATLSIPLLLKVPFWKKVLLLLPLLITKVVGKYLLILFGKNAMSALMGRYGLLERRWQALIDSLQFFRLRMIVRWRETDRDKQAYLILIFLPVAIGVGILVLVIKIVRLRMVRMLVENILGRILNRVAKRIKK